MKLILTKFRAVSLMIPLCGYIASTPANAQFESPSPEIVSAWKFNDGNIVLIFRYDGSFYFIDGEEDSPPGLEFGTFQWNKETGDFSVEISIDSNTDAGFSDPEGATSISITGDTLTYTIAGEGSFPFTRVVNTANPIVGSWYVLDSSKANLTFLADGTYYHSEPGESPGIERGTYTWNQTTKRLTATPITDTNDDIGLSDPLPAGKGFFTAEITGDTMHLDDGESFTLRRVVTNPAPFDLPEFGVLRFANHIQASPNVPALRSIADGFPYTAEAFVHASVGASAPTVKIGSGTPITIDPDFPGGFDSEQGFGDLASLNSFLPASTAIQFKDGAGVANLTTSSSGSFPSIPQIITGGGAWSGGVYHFMEDDFGVINEVLQWSLPDGFDTSQYLTILEIEDADTGEEIVSAYLQGPVRDFDLSGKLEPGKEYEAQLEFYRRDSATTSGTGVFAGKSGQAASSRSTVFTVKSGGINQQVEFVFVDKIILHAQTGPNTVILDPTPVSPTNGGPFGFAANVEGQNMVSLPAPTVTPPPGTPNSPQDPFYSTLFFDDTEQFAWRYGPNANDWGELSQAAIDARFPNGTYTFNVNGVSVPLTLTGDNYPNIPQMTLTGGSWINGKYAIDATSPLSITTNTFTDYGSNVDGLVALKAGDSEIISFHSSTPAANFASLNLPANTLPANEITEVEADFAVIVDKDNSIANSFSAASYSRTLKLEIHILPKIIIQSSSRVMQPDESVNLEVAATGSPVSLGESMLYQWSKDGVILPNETSPTLGVIANSAASSGSYTCTVSNAVGSATTEPIILEYADAYQAYAASFSLNSVTSGASDGDFDNDGIDNLLEFVLGGSPTAANPSLLKSATATPAATGRNLVFFYDRKSAASSINVVIETSPSLTGTWTPAVHGINDVVITTTTLNASTQRITATIPSEETKLFVRLKATR